MGQKKMEGNRLKGEKREKYLLSKTQRVRSALAGGKKAGKLERGK